MSWFTIERKGGAARLMISGPWRIASLPDILAAIKESRPEKISGGIIDGSHLDGIDTAGALLLFRELLHEPVNVEAYELEGFSEESLAILQLVAGGLRPEAPLRGEKELGFVAHVGKGVLDLGALLFELLGFFGETFVESARGVAVPTLLRWRELFVQIETAGIDAIPIVVLVNFLIGIVIAYLFGIQIERYGANILVVNAVSIATCREMSPILVAILIAGRSGSAFTAQIGTMKLNEEIDAMKILGLSPMRVLVVPRVLALMIAMPLLVFLGDIAGILGSMCIADLRLGVTWATFLERMHTVLPLRNVFVGLGKSPLYAIVIAGIGCRMGFAVENNARSVGEHTTATVVQSIVAVILINAALAVFFAELRI